MLRTGVGLAWIYWLASASVLVSVSDAADLREEAASALRKATGYYRGRVASHGGYVYHYTLDLSRRWGEGEATADQVWVQPPGTPAVGEAYLDAFDATGDRSDLDAAREAAGALIFGQLATGGWTNSIDFAPDGPRRARYRDGRGDPKGRANSTLDDDITTAALRFLMRLDRALGFRDRAVHESAGVALDAMLRAQLANGGFPQVWSGPVSRMNPDARASIPAQDWRAGARVKDYWNMPTLNDGVAGNVARTLTLAARVYPEDRRPGPALARLGDFLVRARLPEPQPAWAQQYDAELRPIWARKFEPPAVTCGESQDAISALLLIHETSRDPRHLVPIPAALAYLRRSRLPDGRLPRYRELGTDRPLYMTRRGDAYTPTYDDRDLPAHYGWKVDSRVDSLGRTYEARVAGRPPAPARPDDPATLEKEVAAILKELDDQGRWISPPTSDRLPGQPDLPPGRPFLSSAVFCKNVATLARYLAATR